FRYAPVRISRYRLAEIAALLGDPTRAGIVISLWDGRARPAGELARRAGVMPATASSHLARLVSGGLLRVEPRGRHRYFRLAGPDVADALETLTQLLRSSAAAVRCCAAASTGPSAANIWAARSGRRSRRSCSSATGCGASAGRVRCSSPATGGAG